MLDISNIRIESSRSDNYYTDFDVCLDEVTWCLCDGECGETLKTYTVKFNDDGTIDDDDVEWNSDTDGGYLASYRFLPKAVRSVIEELVSQAIEEEKVFLETFDEDEETVDELKPINFNCKLTASDVREQKGIDYTEPSKERVIPIVTDNGTLYDTLPLVYGNSKLDKSIACFNLPSVYTCPNCKDCRKKCYAKERYPTEWNKHLMAFLSFKHCRDNLKSNIIAQLKRCKRNIVRLHCSGDFFNQDYVNFWADIAEQFTTIKFYTYTKTIRLFDFSRIDALPNFNIVNSILPNGMPNFGDKEYIDAMAKLYGLPVCPATDGETKGVCGVKCFICMQKGTDSVLFYEH